MKMKPKKYNALFGCGHYSNLYYYTDYDLLKKLNEAEKGLCPICDLQYFEKNHNFINMPYGVYRTDYKGKRGVKVGKYNEKTGKISVYLPPSLLKKYEAKNSLRSYNMRFDFIDRNKNINVSICISGNTYEIIDELNKLGFVWYKKIWQKRIIIYPLYDGTLKNYVLPQNKNVKLYELFDKLEKLGCEEDLTLDLYSILTK